MSFYKAYSLGKKKNPHIHLQPPISPLQRQLLKVPFDQSCYVLLCLQIICTCGFLLAFAHFRNNLLTSQNGR